MFDHERNALVGVFDVAIGSIRKIRLSWQNGFICVILNIPNNRLMKLNDYKV